MKNTPTYARPPSVLLVVPEPSVRTVLASILKEAGCRTFLCVRCRDAFELLPFASVVVSEYDLPDGSWRDILEQTKRLPLPPAVVVTSRLAGVDMWAEVLNLGGFDLISPPYRAKDVLWSMQNAHHRHLSLREEQTRESSSPWLARMP